MEPFFTLTVDHDLCIIRYRHKGILDYQEIGKAWQQLLTMKEFTELGYDLLSDYSGSVFDMEVEEGERIIAFMQNIVTIVRGKKQAIIVDDPYSTAVTLLFEQQVYKEIGFIVRTFSTEKGGLEWLKSSP